MGRGIFGRRKSTPTAAPMEFERGESLELPGSGRAAPLPNPLGWKLLGLLYVVLGLTEAGLAALWRFHWVGMGVGFGVTKLGVSLWGLGATGGGKYASMPGFMGRVKAALWSVVLWGSNKIQRLMYYFRWLIILYGSVALLMVLIHLGSPDPKIVAFPAACPPSKRFGCSRIAESAPHATRHMQPLHLNASMPAVVAAGHRWIVAQPQPKLLLQKPDFLHARFLSVFWGFADDVFIGLKCNGHKQTVVEVQGQLRLGKSDLGVNARRNQRLLLALSTAAKDGEIPHGECIPPPLS